ncbi:MAG: 2-hydroxyacid dehydrogenase, partial [Vicinamibacteria bacterium]
MGAPLGAVAKGLAEHFDVVREASPKVRGIAVSGGHVAIDDAFVEAFPALEIVSTSGVGYDHIDAAALARRGVVVTNTPGVLTNEVADLALG